MSRFPVCALIAALLAAPVLADEAPVQQGQPPGPPAPPATVTAEAGAAPALADHPALPVEIVTAQPAAVQRLLAITGEIAARDNLTVAFPAGGRLIELTVAEGAHVQPGALLGRTDPVQAEQNQRAARAALTGAEAEARQAGDEADRQDNLLKQGASTRARRDAARAAADAAEAKVAAARANLDRADKALADTELRAPAEAVITARLAEPGQVVGPAQPVLEIATSAGYDAVFDVPEGYLARPHDLSRQVWMSLVDIHAPPFRGMVREVAPRVDPARGTVRVRIGIEGLPPGVALGAAVRASASMTDGARITLPVWSLTSLDGKPAVWVVDPATQAVSPRAVTLLRHDTMGLVIEGGLEPGERVVGRGAQLLYPGRRVVAAEVK